MEKGGREGEPPTIGRPPPVGRAQREALTCTHLAELASWRSKRAYVSGGGLSGWTARRGSATIGTMRSYLLVLLDPHGLGTPLTAQGPHELPPRSEVLEPRLAALLGACRLLTDPARDVPCWNLSAHRAHEWELGGPPHEALRRDRRLLVVSDVAAEEALAARGAEVVRALAVREQIAVAVSRVCYIPEDYPLGRWIITPSGDWQDSTGAPGGWRLLARYPHHWAAQVAFNPRPADPQWELGFRPY